MRKHPKTPRPEPIDWIDASTEPPGGQLGPLRTGASAAALELARDNAACVASETIELVRLVRQTQWRAAGLLCGGLFRLIQIQMEVERLLSRTANRRGGRRGDRR